MVKSFRNGPAQGAQRCGPHLHAVCCSANSPLRRPIPAKGLQNLIHVAQHQPHTFSEFRLTPAFFQFQVVDPDDQIIERHLAAGYLEGCHRSQSPPTPRLASIRAKADSIFLRSCSLISRSPQGERMTRIQAMTARMLAIVLISRTCAAMAGG